MQEYFIEVGTANYKEVLYRRLRDLRSEEGLPIELYECKNGAFYSVRCVYSTIKGKLDQERLTVRIYNYYFARALAEIIVQRWEGVFIRKILKKEYSLNSGDIEKIMNKTWDNLNKDNNTYLSETRKHMLVKAILEFLDFHKRLDLEGFMNFRAELYKRELKKQIAQAVNEYAIEQEHVGYVRFLKNFLTSQHSIYRTMHLVIKDKGEIVLYDDCGRNVNDQCLEENDGKSNNEYYEDFLIGSILKCAPRHLVAHVNSEQHTDMIQTIHEVFEEKISFCTGCSICRENN